MKNSKQCQLSFYSHDADFNFINGIHQVTNLNYINIWKKDMYQCGRETDKMTTTGRVGPRQDANKQKQAH